MKLEHTVKNSSPIGFFDSGVGGLSVLAEFKKILPDENTIYFGDTANLPYGNKSQSQLIGFAKNIMNFFKEKNVKAVVIACNTSSAQAYNQIKDEYNFKIYPIIQCCAKRIANSGAKRFVVLATESTVKSGMYAQQLLVNNSSLDVIELSCKDWVPLVEGKVSNRQQALENIKAEMQSILKFKPEKIILGCTHFPYLMNEFVKYAPEELFINPAKSFVDYIKSDLLESDLILSNSKVNGYEEFYVSSNPEEFVKNSKLFYEVNELPILIKL